MRGVLRFWADGFDLQGYTKRGRFVVAALLLAGMGAAWVYVVADPRGPKWAATYVILVCALVFVPLQGHVVRRLNDAGLPGWFWLAMLLPWGWAVLGALLLLRRGTKLRSFRMNGGLRLIGLIGLFCLAGIIGSRLVWTPVWVSDADMKPGVLVGDLVLAAHGLPGAAR